MGSQWVGCGSGRLRIGPPGSSPIDLGSSRTAGYETVLGGL